MRLHAALILSRDKEPVAEFEARFWNFQENTSLIDKLEKFDLIRCNLLRKERHSDMTNKNNINANQTLLLFDNSTRTITCKVH